MCCRSDALHKQYLSAFIENAQSGILVVLEMPSISSQSLFVNLEVISPNYPFSKKLSPTAVGLLVPLQ